VAVNHVDPAKAITRYVDEKKLTFKMVMERSGRPNAVGQAYGALAHPTNYLIGADGTVLWRGVGLLQESALRLALAKAGCR
jgi:hypothetical protein